jgi:hypothetical protein
LGSCERNKQDFSDFLYFAIVGKMNCRIFKTYQIGSIMKNFKNLLTGFTFVLVASTGLVSCMSDNGTEKLQAVGDIMIQDTKTDAGIKYGLVIYVNANFEIASGKVTAPGTGGKVYQLTVPSANKYQCSFYPQASDYTIDMPVKGDYAMEIISTSGEVMYGKDAVGEEKLQPIVIKNTEISAGLTKITWDKVTNADAYVVRLYNADRSNILFSTDYLSADLTGYNLSASSVGWATGISPTVGTNYILELLGVRVETDAVTDKGSNLQFITIDSKTIKWQ